MGTSIHKDKSSEGSPMKFLGRRRAGAAAKAMPMPMDTEGGSVNPNVNAAMNTGADAGAGGGKGRTIAKALLNPAGAIANKMGMGDTGLGKVLNPLGGLFGRK
tara:strand:+ start:647 stop:955 length:309 start_codon:yes stop_codon:yes gene_type:complete